MDELSKIEEASRRAGEYLIRGDADRAYREYTEAAELMKAFADKQTEQRRADALRVTELLILKAQKAKMMAQAQSSFRRNKKAADTPKGTGSTAPGDENRNAISRDIQGFTRSAKTRSSSGEDQMKFVPVKSQKVYFSDIAGLDSVKEIIRMRVIEPLLHPEIYERFSKTSNGGILLYGPPGTGKTMIARAIATETELDFFSVRCSDIVGKTFGDGERNLKALFNAARESGNAMIFFDEFESLACKRGGGSTVMNRIVPELLSQMDGFQQAEGRLLILASTNRPWDLDSAVLRPPRMTERIYVGLPDFSARRYMVWKGLDPLPRQEQLDYDHIANELQGFNCADIMAFVEKVKEAPIRRGLEENNTEQFLTIQDVENALAGAHSSVQESDLKAFSRWEETQR